MIAISCNNLTKSYGVDTILKDISFTVSLGDRVGLIGRNGTGKSTLFKILSGALPYDHGDIYISKDLTVGYLEQEPEFDGNNTIYDECLSVFNHLIEMEREIRLLEHEIAKLSDHESSEFKKLMKTYSNLIEEFSNNNGYGYKSEVRGVLKGLSFTEEDFDKPIYQLSGGQKSRLNIAKLLLTKVDILLLDEPTNHLDIEAVSWLETFLKNYDGTVLLITHDRYFLDQIVNKIYEIENNGIIQYEGSYTKFTQYKKNIYMQQMKKYEQQQKEIQRQEELIRRFKQHGTEKLAKRAKSREKRLEKIDIIDKPVLNNNRTRIKFESKIRSGKDVLKVEDLSKRFDDYLLFSNVSFNIYRSERVGLIGPNGIGKTTLFKMILGNTPINHGVIDIGHNVHIGYYDQEQSNLDDENNLIEEIQDANPKLSEPEVRNLLASFLFTGDDAFKQVRDLSGGEKGRLSLLKLMLSKANFLLLDEPTNHLDLDAKEVLEDALLDYPGTILTISHDRYFLNKIATKIIELSKESASEYLGNYDYYVEKKNEPKYPKDSNQSNLKTKTQLKEERRRKKEEEAKKRKEKQELLNIEDQINKLEDKLMELEEMMCKEEIYTNPEKSKEIHNEAETIKSNLAELYAKWEERL